MPQIDENILKKMIEEAKTASMNAYCPYSKFSVGAAVLTDTGEIFTGCNVENASYGLTICGERNAVFRMVAEGKQDIRCVVVYTPTSRPVAPCGACLQVLAEFGRQMRVVSVCKGQERLDTTLHEMLPNGFGSSDLGG